MALRLFLPLNGNLNNQGLDDVTITATDSSCQNDGKIGKCLRLGYTNNFTIPSMVGAKQMTIAYWCRVNTATATNWLDSIHFYSTNGSETHESRHEFFNNCTDTGFWYKGGSVVMYSSHIVIGEWNHFAFTFNYTTGEVSFYFNGSLFQTRTDLDTTHYITGTNFRLGQSGLDVSQNDVRIYDTVLSPLEVKHLAQGLVLHYPLSMPGQENLVKQSNQFRVGTHAAKITPSLLEDGTYQVIAESGNSNYTSSWWMTLDGIENNFVEDEVFTVSFTIKSSDANTTTPPRIYLKEGMGYFQMIGRVVESWSTVYYTGAWKKEHSLAPHLGWYGLVGTYQISNWKLEKGSRPTPWLPNPDDAKYSALGFNDRIEYDVSGFCNNGTKMGTITPSPDTPRYRMSYYFDSSVGSCVQLSDISYENMDYGTISFWIKPVTFNNWMHYLFIANSFNWNAQGSDFIIIAMDGQISSAANKTNVQLDCCSYKKIHSMAVGNWYHVAITWDAVNYEIKKYVNGVLVDTVDDSTNKRLDTYRFRHTYKRLGYYNTSTTTYRPDCNFSDLRIYTTALSADDVLSLYNTPISLANTGSLLTQGEYVEV